MPGRPIRTDYAGRSVVIRANGNMAMLVGDRHESCHKWSKARSPKRDLRPVRNRLQLKASTESAEC